MAKTAKRHVLFLLAVPSLLCGFALWMAARDVSPDDNAVIRKVVDMVQLNVAVTDAKGNYVTGLKPSDFTITEDKISQSVATFEEGNEAPRIITSAGASPAPVAAPIAPQPPPAAAALRETAAQSRHPPSRPPGQSPWSRLRPQ